MITKTTPRPPQYYFAVFGDPGTTKPKVEDGDYPHRGYISSLNMKPGDILLLYCTLPYKQHSMEAPGIGVVTGTSVNNVYYQYFPFDQPVNWVSISATLNQYTNRLKNISLKGNWIFEIDRSSFRSLLKGREIDWP